MIEKSQKNKKVGDEVVNEQAAVDAQSVVHVTNAQQGFLNDMKFDPGSSKIKLDNERCIKNRRDLPTLWHNIIHLLILAEISIQSMLTSQDILFAVEGIAKELSSQYDYIGDKVIIFGYI